MFRSSSRRYYRQLLGASSAGAVVLALSLRSRIQASSSEGGPAPVSHDQARGALSSIQKRLRQRSRVGVSDLVGCTPMLEFTTLSQATGRRILAKLEQANPGGSVKDRAALAMILKAEKDGALPMGGGGVVCEGSGGNTGVALAMMAAVRGHDCIITLPDYVSREKIDAMKSFGARVILCKPVPFSNENHFFHVARREAEAINRESGGKRAVWTNQFDNLANSNAHAFGTGPEMWAQTGGQLDAVCVAAGTGGTVSGLARFLKPISGGRSQVWLVDPPGSCLHRWVATGGREMSPSPGNTFTEGIGIGRMTANYESARGGLIDGAMQGSDQEAVDMMFYLLQHEGLFVGPSAAMNVAGAVRLAQMLPEGSTVATVVCDSGERYKKKLLDGDCEFLREKGLVRGDQGVPKMERGDLWFLPPPGHSAVRWGQDNQKEIGIASADGRKRG